MRKIVCFIVVAVLAVAVFLYGRQIQTIAAEKVVDLMKIGEAAGNAEEKESTPGATTWWIGVSLAPVPEAVRAQLLAGTLENEEGVQVAAVIPGSPAEKAGLKTHDIITRVGNQKITTQRELTEIIQKAENAELKFSVLSAGVSKTVSVTPALMPEEMKARQRAAQPGLIPGGQIPPGGIRIHIPRGDIQIQLPEGGTFPGGGIKKLSENMRKMVEDSFGEGNFENGGFFFGEDGDEEEAEENAENEAEKIDLKERQAVPGEKNDRKSGENRVPVPNFGGNKPGMSVRSGVSVSQHVILQLNGKSLEISLSRTNDNPPKIKAVWEGKDYESDDGTLDIFPEEIRGKVQEIRDNNRTKISVAPGGGVRVFGRGGDAENADTEDDGELKVRSEKIIDLKK